MKVLYYFATVPILFVLISCVKTPIETDVKQDTAIVIEDLEKFPQNAQAYVHNVNSHTDIIPLQKRYDSKYFEPWDYSKPPYTRQSILWPFSSYTYGKSFGENLKLLDESWFIEMKSKGNYEAYGTLNKKAVSLSYLSLRNFPTHKPLFRDPEQAGEGFPFDYMQNSGIHANEPLFISHLSINGEWAYVFTAYATGWVLLKDVAYIDDKIAEIWKSSHQIELVDEQYPIKDLDGNFVFRSRVGMKLALISIEPTHYTALAITAGKNHSSTYTKVKIPLSIARHEKMKINKVNFGKIIDLMLKSNYGWGGLYQEKDCSSMLRDLYAPFGLWLPRNSFQQSKVGRVFDLATLSSKEKREKIIEKGIPFETLLYKKGHILLYLGEYQGKITVLQNVWGIKTLNNGKEGREVIGKTVVSSLGLGKERKDYDEDKDILSQLLSMNIVTQE